MVARTSSPTGSHGNISEGQCFTATIICVLTLLCFFLSRGKQTLRVREHKVLGPYVDGLSRLAVASYKVTVCFSYNDVKFSAVDKQVAHMVIE